jgi:hypothetical protein
MDKRCDGMLTYANCLIFVELKERKGKNSGCGRRRRRATEKRNSGIY